MKFAHGTPPFLSPLPLFPFQDIIPPQENGVLIIAIQNISEKRSFCHGKGM
jgi:hypothetical protein